MKKGNYLDKNRAEKKCTICGKTFYKRIGEGYNQFSKQETCSWICRNKKRMGTKLDEDTKRKIKLSAVNNPNYGMRNKKMSEETKARMSQSRISIWKLKNTLKKICAPKLKIYNGRKNICRFFRILEIEDRKIYILNKRLLFKKNCLICGVEFYRGKGMANKTFEKKTTCSKNCFKEQRKIEHTGIPSGMLGKHHSEISKSKIARQGIKHHFFGKKHSDSTKSMIKAKRALQVMPVRDTSIEVKIQNLLRELKIEFFTHQYMHIEHGYQCDILIPLTKTIIECDGDYWHGNPLKNKKLEEFQLRQREEDAIRTRELEQAGYKVLRLWETEIKQLDSNKLNNILNSVMRT